MLNSRGLSVIAGPREPVPAAYPLGVSLLFKPPYSAADTPKSSGK
jgi:hypothetical protein